MSLQTDIMDFCTALHELIERYRHIPPHQVAARLNDKAVTLQTGSASTLNAEQAEKPLADLAAENAAQPDNPAAEGLDADTSAGQNGLAEQA